MQLYFLGIGVKGEGFGSFPFSIEEADRVVNAGRKRRHFLLVVSGEEEAMYQSLMEEFAKRKWHVAEPLARELRDGVRTALAKQHVDN